MDGYVVLANANAGSAEEEALEAACDVLRADAPTELARTASDRDVDGVLDGLDGRQLVIAGGDGSVHLVMQHLHDRGEADRTTLGLVPLGTGNDLARGLGIPLEPDGAARVVVGGAVRRLDLLEDDAGGVAVNAVHAGLGAEAAQRSEAMKEDLGPLAYPIGALIAGVQESGWALEVSVDGERVAPDDGPVLMVGICNGSTIGGGAPLCGAAVPDDGKLDVVVVAALGPAARTAFGAALRKGRHLERDDVVHSTGTEVGIEGDPVRYNADGEVSGAVGSRTYRLRPSAWGLLVPGSGGG
ncbi:MAG: diacylglycerol kinase [Actinobacteria bacterium]|nr:diacylglycerol kinase [Actinomycetota bacterium]